jgi:hypothetical protein
MHEVQKRGAPDLVTMGGDLMAHNIPRLPGCERSCDEVAHVLMRYCHHILGLVEFCAGFKICEFS